MKYAIMLLIVVGMAVADFITGIIKAKIKDEINSKAMRRGGLGKLAEIIVMTATCGLEIGMTALGGFYGQEQLTSIAGNITAIAVFGYIVIMEIVSLLENYAEINPKAQWVFKLIRNPNEKKEDKK